VTEVKARIVSHVLAFLGLAAGLLLAVLAARSLSTLLYEVSPLDPLTFGSVVAILSASALLACYLPARRAARVDPAVALRHD
jgi:ABC-type antimicrobial peptide transport system permease subunit